MNSAARFGVVGRKAAGQGGCGRCWAFLLAFWAFAARCGAGICRRWRGSTRLASAHPGLGGGVWRRALRCQPAGALAGAGAGRPAAPGDRLARGRLDRGRGPCRARSGSVAALRAGVFRPGWSRLVLELAGPMCGRGRDDDTRGEGAVLQPAAGCRRGGRGFAAAAARPTRPDWALPEAADLPAAPPPETGRLVVVLDPGHGGIDPGAERDGVTEAELMLTFARELKEVLLRDGRFNVVLTRDEDVFVPLETRISIARDGRGGHVPVAACRCAGRGRGGGRHDLHPGRRGHATRPRPRWPNGMTATTFWPGST